MKNANTANGSKPATTPETGNGKQVATTVTLTPVRDEKKDDSKPAPSVPGLRLSDLPPVEDRILRVQQLFDLTAKREKLKDSLKKLSSIKASTESRDLKITIEDSDNDWETFNTDAIKACIECMKETIKRKLDEVENLIRF
ncbi:MAG: hypothetical protein ACTHKV_08525 [Flavipsychrobacter sp.]